MSQSNSDTASNKEDTIDTENASAQQVQLVPSPKKCIPTSRLSEENMDMNTKEGLLWWAKAQNKPFADWKPCDINTTNITKVYDAV